MKTRLYELPDWQCVLNQIGWADAPTTQSIEEAVRRELTRGKVTFEEQDPGCPIEKGCRVTLKTESRLPKFNKARTVIQVGSNLYHARLEERLCGMKAGGCGQLTVNGETVTFTVLKVEQKAYPALTDALVQEQGIEGVATLEEYRLFLRRKLQKEYAATLCKKLLAELGGRAKMDPPAGEDIIRVIDLEYEPLRVRFSLDTLTPEEWEEGFGKTELKEFYAQIYPDVANLFGTTGKESYYEGRREAACEKIVNCLILKTILEDGETDPVEDLQAEEKLMQAMTQRLVNSIYGG